MHKEHNVPQNYTKKFHGEDFDTKLKKKVSPQTCPLTKPPPPPCSSKMHLCGPGTHTHTHVPTYTQWFVCNAKKERAGGGMLMPSSNVRCSLKS